MSEELCNSHKSSQKINRETKVKFTNIRLNLLYRLYLLDSELSEINTRQESKMLASELKLLAGIKGYVKLGHIRSYVLWKYTLYELTS